MKIAVVTKHNMLENEHRNRILKYLASCEDIELDILQSSSQISCDTDRVLVFGGDGTMLDVAGDVCDLQIPILGVNLGKLGFLAECEKDTTGDVVLNALQNGQIEDKMLISATIKSDICHKALNEVVIKSESSRPVFLDLTINGKYVDTYHSDGIIISSPTGSTAYALSAGGPILDPSVNAFVVLPICPHSLHSRPLVVNDASNIELSLKGNEKASVCVDGKIVAKVLGNERIFVSRANKNAKFITLGDDDFYKKLFQKMNMWGITQQL